MMRATTPCRLAGLLHCSSPTLLAAASPPTPTNIGELAECRQAVERVLWERSLWPEENPGPKPEFDELVSLEDIAVRMQDVLLRADALGKRWHQPVDQAALEQELQRMRGTSQDRELLAALIEAVGSRPRAALCVAMPDLVLSEFHAAYANDLNVHGARRVEIERRLEKGPAYPAALGPDVAVHSERFERNPTAHHDTAGGLPAAAWQSVLARFDIQPDEPDAGSEVGKAARAELGAYIGPRTGLMERHGDFALQEITAADEDLVTIRTMVWAKQPLHAWWSRARAGFDAHIPRFESKANTVVENTSPLPDPLLPGARYGQAAAWTGTEMIIWGGRDGVAPLADGYCYTPATNSWAPLVDFNAPTARWLPSVVCTGLDVIIWGGASTTGGGVTPSDHKRYRPTADQWDTLTAAPISSRYHHAAVWTGSRMIISGGIENGFGVASSGALYNPADNSWEAMTAPSPPSARFRAVAVWTCYEMVVWGGEADGGVHLGDGARFTPGAPGSWAAVTATPGVRSLHTAVWTGPPLNRMLVWGGKFASASALADGALYGPAGNAWTTMASGGPTARYFHTAVWTDSELIVWGGTPDNVEWLSSGARYVPASNKWTSSTTLVYAPTGCYIHTAVWSGDDREAVGKARKSGATLHLGMEGRP